MDLADHLGPAAAEDPRALLFNDQGLVRCFLRLAHLAPVGIGVQPILADGDLAVVRDMRSDPGDELQVVHPLLLFSTSQCFRLSRGR